MCACAYERRARAVADRTKGEKVRSFHKRAALGKVSRDSLHTHCSVYIQYTRDFARVHHFSRAAQRGKSTFFAFASRADVNAQALLKKARETEAAEKESVSDRAVEIEIMLCDDEPHSLGMFKFDPQATVQYAHTHTHTRIDTHTRTRTRTRASLACTLAVTAIET
jgi:hypothetical protein